MDVQRIALMGAPGSPYTRKMLAVLRYRRLPYRLLTRAQAAAEVLPAPRVALLPTFYLPNAEARIEAVVDSSPLIRRLERDYAGRAIIPDDPGLAFLDALIEDYADEWLTKAMFHYRWNYAADIQRSGRMLPLWQDYRISDATLAQRAAAISDRQIGRLYVVGSNAVTAPVIEASYRRFLAAFERHLETHAFLLGERPAACDFAVYGQLTQLAMFDPTPMALTLEIAPRVYAWTSLMEDMSGLEPGEDGWISPASVPATLRALLVEIGRVYPPVMLANAQALATGAAEVETQVDGLAWRQPPFPYQAKCLQALRNARADLAASNLAEVDATLAGTGCETLFA